MKGMSSSTDERIFRSVQAAVEKGFIIPEDTIVYVAGSLLGTAIMTETNLFQIYKVATVLDSAKVIHKFD